MEDQAYEHPSQGYRTEEKPARSTAYDIAVETGGILTACHEVLDSIRAEPSASPVPADGPGDLRAVLSENLGRLTLLRERLKELKEYLGRA
jgi:hypothetical protein